MKYRKKPVEIDAEQYNGQYIEGMHYPIDYSEQHLSDVSPYIQTLEGRMDVTHGDWIITGVKGEKYPCKPDIFEKTYEPAGEASNDARSRGDGCDVSNIEGIAMKYTVLKTDDLTNFLTDSEITQFSNFQSKVMFERLKTGKKKENIYVVVNTDEPYADEVISIMKRHGHWG